MLKIFLNVIAIAGLMALSVFGPRLLMLNPGQQSSEGVVECNVLKDKCQWSQQGNHWDAQLTKIGGESGDTEYQLSVKTDASQPRLLALLRGESMYMGEYPVSMTRAEVAEDGDTYLWEARFAPPFCMMDPDMTWRIDLQTGIGEEVDRPMKLIFRAEGRI